MNPARAARLSIRSGQHVAHTAGLAPGHVQGNLCIVPREYAADFRLFCERPAEQPSTLVVVESAEVAADGALILVRLAASHFLWKMVRRVVGTLVQVGAGELDRRGFEALLAARAPKSGKGLPAEWTAPPSGLFLERVLYAGDLPLGPIVPAAPVTDFGF